MHTPPPQVVAHPAGPEKPRHLYVLLAEDNAVNQKLAVHLLEKQGHTVTVVGDGQAALALLAQQSFDLVLLDVQMPIMDGLEATAAIRAQERLTGRHIPIIAVTAHAMKGDEERCLAAGMDAYVTKPLKKSDLSAAIARVLGPQTVPTLSSPIDLAAAMRLVDGDHALLGEVVETFLQRYPLDVAELHIAIAQSDRARLKRVVHGLKSAAGSIGATQAQTIAAELESISDTAYLEDLGSLLQRLDDELERIAAFLAKPTWP